MAYPKYRTFVEELQSIIAFHHTRGPAMIVENVCWWWNNQLLEFHRRDMPAEVKIVISCILYARKRDKDLNQNSSEQTIKHVSKLYKILTKLSKKQEKRERKEKNDTENRTTTNTANDAN